MAGAQIAPETASASVESPQKPAPSAEAGSGDSSGATTAHVAKSLCYFDVDHPLRAWCIKTIAPGTWFDNFILFLIIFNSITMGLTDYGVVEKSSNTPTGGSGSTKGYRIGSDFDSSTESGNNIFVEVAELPFLILFTLEMLTKMVALGFRGGANTYIKDSWNKLDFLVVLVGWLGVIMDQVDPEALPINLGVLRAFRVLRPLRSISRLPGLRRVIQSLIASIPQLIDLVFLVVFALLIFSILGMQLFSGKMHNRCRVTEFPVKLDPTCVSVADDCWSDFIQKVTDVSTREDWICEDSSGNKINTPDKDIKDKSGSPWATPRDCIWPMSEDDTALCSPDSNLGKHSCVASEYCGSNFDPYGNPRFIDTLVPYGYPRMKSGTWSEDYNWGVTQFDNIGQSFVTIFQAVSEEGWTDIMYACMDVDGGVSSYIVFVLLILCGSFFLMNLFLAAIGIEEEEEEKEEGEGGGEQGKEEGGENNKDSSVPSDGSDGGAIGVTIDMNPVRRLLYDFVESKAFSRFIIVCILVNTITLSMDTFPEPDYMKDVEVVNVVLTYIFIVEMVLKVPALGPMGYVSDPFNVFDAFIVTVSVIELALAASSSDEEAGPSGMSALRTFRLFRVFKLAKQWTEMQILLKAMVRTVFDIANFAVLLGLFMYIMALVGMQFFANEMHFDADTGEKISFKDTSDFNSHDVMENIPRNNFDDLMWSLTTIFQFLSGENWNSIMYDCFRAVGWGGVIYSLVVFVVGVMIVMNLFLAILLSNFEGNDDLIKVGTESSRSSNDLGAPTNSEDGEEEGVDSDAKSLFIFASDNPVRKLCTDISSSKKFENFIIFLILFSSCTLAVDNPLDQPSDLLKALDLVMTILFGFELVIKVISLGFIAHKGSYMRSGWNVLDFLIVAISFMALGGVGPGKSLRALRTVRVLRPLRMVKRLPELQLVVNALINSVPAVANVLLICFLFFLIFAILGVNLFKGKLYACGGDGSYDDDACPLGDDLCDLVLNPVKWNAMSTHQKSLFDPSSSCYKSIDEGSDELPTSKQICDCGDPEAWQGVLPRSFDNVGDALLLLYELSTTEGWVDYMYATVDSEGVDMQPTRYRKVNGVWNYSNKSSTALIILFYVMFIVVGSFFVINLFVGVVIDNFNSLKAANEGGGIFMTEEQKEWSNTLKFVMKLRPKRKFLPPTSKLRKTAHDIVNVEKPISFDAFIMGCILLNSLIMAMEYHGMSDGYRMALTVINYIFALIFTIEMILKVMALGWKRYLMDSWNRFDCLIVFGTDIGLILYFASGIEIGSIASVVRMCRIGRIFRLINSAKSLNRYFTTIIASLPSLYNIGLLLFLLFFIYAVMAVQIFSKVRLNDDYTNRANFRNFGHSFMTLFRFSTGENWNGFMHSMLSENGDNFECHLDPPYPVNSEWCFGSSKDPCSSQVTSYEIENLSDAQLAKFGSSDCCIELYGCGDGGWAYFFFYTFTLFVTFVMLNLFLGVILEAFEDNETGDSLTPGELDLFCEDWCRFDNDGTGFMKVSDLTSFMQILDKPMGFGEEYDASSDELYMRLDECGIMQIEVEKADEPVVGIYDVAKELAKRVVREKTGTADIVLPTEEDAQEAEAAHAHNKLTVREILHPQYSMSESELKKSGTTRLEQAAESAQQDEKKEDDDTFEAAEAGGIAAEGATDGAAEVEGDKHEGDNSNADADGGGDGGSKEAESETVEAGEKT